MKKMMLYQKIKMLFMIIVLMIHHKVFIHFRILLSELIERILYQKHKENILKILQKLILLTEDIV